MPESRRLSRTAFEPSAVLMALAVTMFVVFLVPMVANGLGNRRAGEPRTGARDKDRMNSHIALTPSREYATIDGAAQ
ncbi:MULTISPECIES: hypothetical protein [Burkholderia]|uniref:hypothetical protein n=1 Tax=Burkholderia TaxID=32008 RepID=UPI000C014E26|nr:MULTISPECIES: hypothetical protein [Burkholderia]PFH30139.1 hypothetical protein BX604_3925 [Burkholderia sp. JKS000303]